MEHAWVVSRDDEVEIVLAHPDLHVRPPGQQIPPLMQGTLLGDVFSRLARMNEGARHERLRASVVNILESWDVDAARELSRTAARTLPLADIGAYVVATLLGMREPIAAIPLIRDFAGAVAAGASDDAVMRGVAATPALFEGLPGGENADEKANRLGFLFQTYAAVGALIENRLEGRAMPPVVVTRRWAARDAHLLGAEIKRGDAFVVLLITPKFNFGAGRHACPGEGLARAIADAAVDAYLTANPRPRSRSIIASEYGQPRET